MPRLGKLLTAFLALATLDSTSARADEGSIAVVLAATAPGFATGQLLRQPTIDVPDGASVTFLLASGQSVTVKGPYTGELARLRPVRTAGLGEIMSAGVDRSEIGGTRSFTAATPADAPAAPTIDPAAGGVWCLPPSVMPRLARPADPTFDELELRDESGGREVRLSWTGGDELAWPGELAAGPARLTVTSLRTGAERHLELRVLPMSKRNEAARAAALSLAGCARQAAGAMERLREAIVPLDLYLASDRGRYPSYRRGELIELIVQTNHDAFVYCVLRDSRGQVLPLFPPQPAQAHIRNGMPLRLPAAASPFALRAGPGLDGGEVRCIASEHDLARELPELAAARGPVPLTEATVAALDEALADPRQGRVVMAQMILRVGN